MAVEGYYCLSCKEGAEREGDAKGGSWEKLDFNTDQTCDDHNHKTAAYKYVR